MDISMINGMSIQIVPTHKVQIRTHRKKRINKKWAKRYGFRVYDILEDGKIIMIGGIMYMNRKTHDDLHKHIWKGKGKER